MKIAIIEDRMNRLSHFIEFDLSSYKSVEIITGNDFDNIILALEAGNTSLLEQYACIASHRSALSNETRDTIKNFCKKNNKPLIFFSGGIASSVYKDIDFPFLHVNSKDFYSKNLKLFIDHYEKNKHINLFVLQFGQKWKLSLLLNLRNKIAVSQNLQAIKAVNSSILIDDDDIIKRVIDLQINKLIKPDLINSETNSILSGNDYSLINAEQLHEMKQIINRLINDVL